MGAKKVRFYEVDKKQEADIKQRLFKGGQEK